jgi:hypothetical protein
MASFDNNISRIEVIVEGLRDLADEMVFVGGACVQFYVPNPENHDCRPTKDVDCVIQIANYLKFNQFSEKMRSLSFTHDTSTNAPIIRWLYKNIKVNTIPEEGSAGITGFEDSPWFKEGRMYAEERELPSGKRIKILPLAYFFATKLDASKNRGQGDYLTDHDMEDLIGIIDANDDLLEILEAPANVRHHIVEHFSRLLNNMAFRRSIAGHIGFGSIASDRANDIEEKMNEIINK